MRYSNHEWSTFLYILGPYQPSNELMLKFYGYYKQASIGPCDSPKPSFWDVINRAKWDAWHKLGDMSSEDAMNHYVEELKQVPIYIRYTFFVKSQHS